METRRLYFQMKDLEKSEDGNSNPKTHTDVTQRTETRGSGCQEPRKRCDKGRDHVVRPLSSHPSAKARIPQSGELFRAHLPFGVTVRVRCLMEVAETSHHDPHVSLPRFWLLMVDPTL